MKVKKEKKKEEKELLTVHSSIDAEQPYHYSAGRYRSRFFVELRDNRKFIGVRCPNCRRVYSPPKEVCGSCFRKMEEPVDVGPQGTIITFTIVRFGFVDPETGTKKPVPYASGCIQLDGADNTISHFIGYDDESKVRVGARVEPVFAEERIGNLKDIKHFRVID
ncbi:MAG: Zn-ribbon domain-containing OB-fold protein [Deltaproteobacteria bacterium]|nr:MAG: Zn-ribbon domain-containing OB-fold protein [Deltaproteobacteria bacterium]